MSLKEWLSDELDKAENKINPPPDASKNCIIVRDWLGEEVPADFKGRVLRFVRVVCVPSLDAPDEIVEPAAPDPLPAVAESTPVQPLEPVTEKPRERRLPVSGGDVVSLSLRDRSQKPTTPGRWGWVTTSVYRDKGRWVNFDVEYPESGVFMVPDK